jgi:hypothetical protein
MASRKAPLRSSTEVDQRRIQEFLEQAAPIILQNRRLEGKALSAVVTLATDLGVPNRRLHDELRHLVARGVIATVAWEALPPPESGQRDAAPEPTAGGGTRKPEPRRVRPSSLPPAAKPKSSPPPVRKPRARPAAEAAVSTAAVDHFRRMAQQLIAQHGGVTPTCHKLLATEAERLGLQADDLETVLQSLSTQEPAEPLPAPPVASEEEADVGPRESPADAFRQWVHSQLIAYPSAVLTVDDEIGLVGVGVHRHRLAEVLAVHVVRDVATELEKRLERDLEGASYNSTMDATAAPSSDDERLRRFYDQVAPILALHRGINAQSRVMLNAVAERMGLSKEQLEQALASFETPANDQQDELRQNERRESFRRYLRRTIAQLPEGIITFKTERRLAEAGELFHGVSSQLIKPTINEVASEVGARFISEDQAVEHIVELVDDLLSQTIYIDGDTRSRIYDEGTRWGLDPVDVEAILRQRVQRARDLIHAERRRTRLVLMFAAIGFVAAVGLLLWILVADEGGGVNEPPARGNLAERLPPKDNSASPKQWWSDDLKIAVAAARVSFPEQRDVFDQAASPLPSQRGQAYEAIVDQLPPVVTDDERQQQLQRLLIELFVGEPSDAAARQLATALLEPLTEMDEALPDNTARVPAMYRSCAAAVRMLAHPDLADERAAWLDQMLEAAVGQVVDRSFDVESLEQQCLAALSEHFYRALVRAAPEAPRQAARLYWPVAAEAKKHLDPSTLQRLDADFLVALLPRLQDEWQDFRGEIRRIVRADEPDVLLKMLEVYPQIDDLLLHSFLTQEFLDRVGAEPGTLTEEELIAEVRESLGVSADPQGMRRWSQLAAEASELLGRPRVEGKDPSLLLQECLQLAHLATQACALTRHEEGFSTFDKLQEEGPTELEISTGPFSGAPDRTPSLVRRPPASNSMVGHYIGMLAASPSVAQRLQMLQMVVNQVDLVSDLESEEAAKLAKYLVRFKPDQREHQEMMDHVARLTNWRSVRIGLADELGRVTGRDKQLNDLFTAILGEPVSVGTQPDRARVKYQLLAQVVEEMAEQPDTAADPVQDPVFDAGKAALARLAATQARLLGVSLDSSQTEQLSNVLKLMLPVLADRMDPATLPAEDRQLITQLPFTLQAVAFSAENDLQLTVLLEQLRMRWLAAQLSQQQPERTAAARAVVSRLETRDRESKHVMVQLHNVHQAMLELWLLYQPNESPGGEGERRS